MDVDKKSKKKKPTPPRGPSGLTLYSSKFWGIALFLLMAGLGTYSFSLMVDLFKNYKECSEYFSKVNSGETVSRAFIEVASLREEHGKSSHIDYYILCRDRETNREETFDVTRECYMKFEKGKTVWFKVKRKDWEKDYIPPVPTGIKEDVTAPVMVFMPFLILIIFTFWCASMVSDYEWEHLIWTKKKYSNWRTVTGRNTYAEMEKYYKDLHLKWRIAPGIFIGILGLGTWLGGLVFIILATI